MFCLIRQPNNVFLYHVLFCVVYGFLLFEGVADRVLSTSLSSSRQFNKTGVQHASVMDRIIAVNFQQNNLTLGENAQKRQDVGSNIVKINNGNNISEYLFEGDVIVDENDTSDAELLRVWERGDNDSQAIKRQTTRSLKWLWHTKQVPYIISPNLDKVRSQILNAIRIFNSKTCVKFVPKRKYERNYAIFDKREGCYSRIGKSYSRPGPQIISVGEFCEPPGILIHEMLHCVGFYHEQSRPDRDKNVEILWENIPSALQNQFKKYSHGEIDNLGVNYNRRSIMHYGKTAFSKSPKLPSILAIDHPEEELGNDEMSPEDVIQLDALYQCKNSTFNSWTRWSSFSPCDSRCYKSKQRFCYGRTPKACGGKPNKYGVERTYVKCSQQECFGKVNGHWSMWSSWQRCSKTCDEGIKSRKRACNNPAPKNGGGRCRGRAVENVMCFQPRCTLGKYGDDFRHGHSVFWQNDVYNTPGFHWHIRKGLTPKETTGPIGDHTTTKSYYMYTRSPWGSAHGTARLFSRVLPRTSTKIKCLKFFYNMFGSTVGSLAVRLYPERESKPKTIFSKSGNQGQRWKPFNITLFTQDNFQLAFEATIVNSYSSDIAIDDVFIDDGSCDCQDDYRTSCKFWAKKGSCKTAYNFMFIHCKRSCNFCDCRDKPQCKQWPRTECQKNPGYMEIYCPVMCRVCDCYDMNFYCPWWATRYKSPGSKQCELNPQLNPYSKYMKIYCRKSCKLCT